MRFKVHYPKMLVLTLLGIVAFGSAMAINASGQSGYAGPAVFPAIPTVPQLTTDEVRQVREIVDDSGVVKAINGDQEWEVLDVHRIDVGGKEVVRLKVEWDDPVTSSGPWRDVECSGTRRVDVGLEFNEITRLSLYVDVPDKTVIANAIGAPARGETGAGLASPDEDPKVKVYDTKTGQLVFDGHLSDIDLKCDPETEQG